MANLLLWGHRLADYQRMFNLTDDDIKRKIIDCGAGPASFNADMHELGHHVISVDEIYQMPFADLKQFVNAEYQLMYQNIQQHLDKFNWHEYPDLDSLDSIRHQGLTKFLADFPQGLQSGRYSAEEVIALSFADNSFDIALSLHHLFTFKAEKGVDYHVAAIKEMVRVANEVRIFPLLDGLGEITPLLGPVLLELQNENYGAEIKEVPFALHKNGNAMLRVWAQECQLD